MALLCPRPTSQRADSGRFNGSSVVGSSYSPYSLWQRPSGLCDNGRPELRLVQPRRRHTSGSSGPATQHLRLVWTSPAPPCAAAGEPCSTSVDPRRISRPPGGLDLEARSNAPGAGDPGASVPTIFGDTPARDYGWRMCLIYLTIGKFPSGYRRCHRLTDEFRAEQPLVQAGTA